MALKYIFTNNAESKLAVAMGGSDSTAQVTAGEGTLFPDPTEGTECFVIQVVEGSQKAYMTCTVRATDVLTVTRTDSYSFTTNATVKCVLNAAILTTFLQKGTEREVAGDPEVLGTVAAYFGEEVFNTVDETWHKDCDGTWKPMPGTE
jgi:hypothetical protein